MIYKQLIDVIELDRKGKKILNYSSRKLSRFIFRPVRIIRLVCQNSFEEVILRRAEAKLRLSKSIMENNELGSGLNTTIETKTQVCQYFTKDL